VLSPPLSTTLNAPVLPPVSTVTSDMVGGSALFHSVGVELSKHNARQSDKCWTFGQYCFGFNFKMEPYAFEYVMKLVLQM